MKLHAKRWGLVFAALLFIGAVTHPPRCHAADLSEVIGYAAGVNGVWSDPAGAPDNLELGGNLRASLSPHISAVTALYYGFDPSYFRWSGGGRVTATDVDDPNFSIGLGIQYHRGSKALLYPNEWAPDASVGWRPWPDPAGTPKSERTLKSHLLLAGQGSYGLTSKNAKLIAGARYAF